MVPFLFSLNKHSYVFTSSSFPLFTVQSVLYRYFFFLLNNLSVLEIYHISGVEWVVNTGMAFPVDFKGLVHPKMKIKSLITHPHAVPTP